MVLLHTGMRSGECLGLQWDDIDFTNRKIHIRHTLTDVGGKHFLTTPKTATSIRDLYMNDMLITLLKKQKAEQLKLQMALGSTFAHPEMIFASNTGTYTAVLDSSRQKTAELMEELLTKQTPNKHQFTKIG